MILRPALGVAPPVLYRAISAEGPLEARRPRTLVSATFSLEVAMSLCGSPSDGGSARLDRQVVPLERVFMSCLETAAHGREAALSSQIEGTPRRTGSPRPDMGTWAGFATGFRS